VNDVDVYPWFALLTSLGAGVFFALHVVHSGRNYSRFHDDRAAYELLVAIILLVVAIGLCISASAAFIDTIGVSGRAEMRNLGLGVVRGAVLLGAIALWTADIKLSRAR
jgi:hypothetical protein